METRTEGQPGSRLTVTGHSGDGVTRQGWKLAIIIAVVLLMRLPFLNQAIQGDDVYYLAEAQHAQIEPAHPSHFHYVFLGQPVDMRGHSHPPFDAWTLGLLLAVTGDIHEVPFHVAYIVFSLIAAIAMWSLARRFSSHPLWATLLFLATPAFVINGTSLESDLPFLAFWMASIALFAGERYAGAAFALALASMTAFQAVLLTPILALYVWLFARKQPKAWLVTLTPPATILAWQVFERVTTGALPASVLVGYFESYGFQALTQKLRSAAALTIHACWLVFPLLIPLAIAFYWKRRKSGWQPGQLFLAGWIAIFFAGAIVIFFAGSARYLLPMAAPVCLLVSELPTKWLKIGFVAQFALTMALAEVNYRHWDAYRRFAASLAPEATHHRIWINGDWGLRYYLESEGGLPLQRGQSVEPGDIVVTSELSYPVAFTTGGGTLTPVAKMEIRPRIPLRLIGLDSCAGYSTSSKGLCPFGISDGPIDRIRAELMVALQPTREDLPMNAPEAAQQIVSGIYPQEGNWRWMSSRAVILLKSPAKAMPLRVAFFIPPAAPARHVTVLLDGKEIAAGLYPAPGSYTLLSPVQMLQKPTATITILVDKTFSVAGDSRELGLILSEVGFKP